MESLPKCTKCGSKFTYEDGVVYICPECAHEWPIHEEDEKAEEKSVVKDAHGNELRDGDSVTIIKDLKVKGASASIKVGLKVKNIRLIDEVNGHNIEAKVPGFGSMLLKSEIVKKSD